METMEAEDKEGAMVTRVLGSTDAMAIMTVLLGNLTYFRSPRFQRPEIVLAYVHRSEFIIDRHRDRAQEQRTP